MLSAPGDPVFFSWYLLQYFRAAVGTVLARKAVNRMQREDTRNNGAHLLTWRNVTGNNEKQPAATTGNGLLMRFGFTPIRGSNPRASAFDLGVRRNRRAPCLV